MLTRRLIPPPTLLCRSYLSSVTYGGLGPATAGPASRNPPRPSGRVPCVCVRVSSAPAKLSFAYLHSMQLYR
ncbi:hypothetical protein L249_6633 [Ophiocordyceps polyrhachis-furcata BCC 54312]|uniref:Uncharacterized protein n=1 Tax=Ophiocordyceps polyrhachis-furcata BCC 54312 TaxID=1330021 RepID=A0A367LLA3_9HYPO|nr:hypothetical protein L249_6633 [Ophiocordyceps polyrhachis-furcata BCC 54312]